MGQTYIIDTSCAIKYLNETLPEQGYQAVNYLFTEGFTAISVISQIELLAWKQQNSSDLEVIKEFIGFSRIVSLTDAVITKTIEIRRDFGLKLPDAVISATAIVTDSILLADNDKDFKKVINLRYLNPRTDTINL